MFITDATSLPILMACIGSRRFAEIIGQPASRRPSSTRNEGDAVHWAIEYIIRNDGTMPAENTKAANGVSLTSEMIEHAQEYVSCVHENSSEYEVNTTLDGDGWRVNGRADHIAYDAVNNTLQVDDFKYGWRIVEPDNNYTLIWHAIGYCVKRNISPETIRLSIYQPRPYHADGPVRTWLISYQDLMAAHFAITSRLSNPSDTLTTSQECHYCPLMAQCPAARKAALNAVDISEAAHNDELDNHELSRELDMLQRATIVINDRIGALQNMAQHRLAKGDVIENYSLEQGLSNARWKEGVTAEILLAMSGQNVAQTKLVSPTEAKRRGVHADLIKAFTERVPTQLKLVRVEADKKAKRLLAKGTR